MASGQISAEERLRIATSAAHIGVWEWHLADDSMVYSDIAKQICGWSNDTVVTMPMVRAVTHPDDLPNTSAAAGRALDPSIRENVVYKYRIRRADTGEQRWVMAYGEAQFETVDGVTRASRYIGTLQDVTEQEMAAQARTESETRLHLAIEAAQMAVWELDTATGVVTGSVELNRLCGFPDDAKPTLQELQDRYAPGERERLEAEGAAALARGDTRLQSEIRQIWPDGTEKWLLLRIQFAPLPDASGHKVTGVLLDITDRKRREEQLALVSHELRHRIKNSLAVAGALAHQAIISKDDPRTAAQDFMGRLAAMGAANDLIFSHPDEAVGLHELVDRIIAPYRGVDRFDISGPTVLLPGTLANRLALALHELCTNAVKYGALSSPQGRVRMTWTHQDRHLDLGWRESGGPPVTPPAKPGFGTRLLLRGIFAPPNTLRIDYSPAGVTADMALSLDT